MSDHRARYKNAGLDTKELRRRREENTIQLRRQKRDDLLTKRRTLAVPDDENQRMADVESCSNDALNLDSSPNHTNSMPMITKEVVDAFMQNEDQQLLLDVTQQIRKYMSKEPYPPTDEVIQAGLLPRFVELLDAHDRPSLQFDVAWILTNICSGTTEQTNAVVYAGAVPKLISLINSPDTNVCEQAVWALGNIIGDGHELREVVINHGFLEPFLKLIKPDVRVSFLKNITWVIVNICRRKEPRLDTQIIYQLVNAAKVLIKSSDIEVLVDITWAISYITEGGGIHIQLIIEAELHKELTKLLNHKEVRIRVAAIRALGSIATGDAQETQSVIDAGALAQLKLVLHEGNPKCIKDTLWFISNIAAGLTSQVQAIIDNQLLDYIVHYLDKGDFSQQKEAAWTIFNFCLSGNATQILELCKIDIIPPLCNLLDFKDSSVVRNTLETLSILLDCSDYNIRERICDEIETCGGLDKIEQLQTNQNTEIYQFASKIIEKHFNGESEPEDEGQVNGVSTYNW